VPAVDTNEVSDVGSGDDTISSFFLFICLVGICFATGCFTNLVLVMTAFVTLVLYGVFTLVAAALARRSANTGLTDFKFFAFGRGVDVENEVAVVGDVVDFRTGGNGVHCPFSPDSFGLGFIEDIEATRGRGGEDDNDDTPPVLLFNCPPCVVVVEIAVVVELSLDLDVLISGGDELAREIGRRFVVGVPLIFGLLFLLPAALVFILVFTIETDGGEILGRI
jgi:hypothetical protein